jgi:hypothetical protein
MENFRDFLAARLARQRKDGEAHPEADLLTAFAEARLGKGERKHVLAHLAVCAECRDVVALASSSLDSAPVAEEPGVRWWNLRWAAAGVVVWHSSSVPQAVLQTPAVSGTVTAAKPAQSAEPAPKAETPKPEMRRAVAARAKVEQQVTPVIPAATPSELASQSVAILQATPEAQPQPLAMALRSQQATLAKAFMGQQSLWSINSSTGMLQKSGDEGKTWTPVFIDAKTNFLALLASGSDIWAGGEGGALFRSADNGSRWKEVQVVDREERLRDSIIRIEAKGSQVKVITKSGEWISADGGLSWRKQALE